MNRFAAFALSFMAACMPAPQDTTTRAVALTSALPPMKTFTADFRAPARRANAEIAQDFLDLSFHMESGRAIPVLTKFEGPVSVRVTGQVNPTMIRDLQSLLGRMKSEAGIPIHYSTGSAPTHITVEAVPRSVMQAAVPRAACFVVPRLTSWEEFKIARRTPQVDWTTLTRRDRAVIFVPSDVAPQEIRDCLHEELAQALGPLNDLYRLPDSVFNDDNIHTVLTRFDMLILRAYYDPAIRNGMTRGEVAARLPSILARINPGGQKAPTRARNDTSRDWIEAIETALANGSSPTRRRNAAHKAVMLSNAFGWTGPRQGFAHYANGRLQVGNDPNAALQSFNAAENVYRRSPDTQIHAAHIAVQQSAFTLAAGDAERTIMLADRYIEIAKMHQNAALMSTLMMFKAEALELQGNTAMAEALRLDSLGWARYGFGSESNVQARLNEIAALRPF